MQRLRKIAFSAFSLGVLGYSFAASAFAALDCTFSVFGGANLPGCKGFALNTAVSSVLNILFLAAFLIALVFLIVGGIKWVMSGGEKDAAQKARDTVTSALIGLAVVLGSFILINLILTFVLGSNTGNLNVTNQQLNVGG